MLATYKDFLTKNKNCSKFENDRDMIDVFDYLSQNDIIIKMIEAADGLKPSMSPIAADIENIFTDESKQHENSLEDNFTKQAVGLIIKTILEPFGYIPWKQKDLPKAAGAEKFQSASVYRFDENAPRTMRIVKMIEEIK
jgi:hypothetical protein